MERVRLSTSDWQVTGFVASGFVDRLLGMWRAPAGSVVIIPSRSVHSFGRRRPLQLIGLDAEMRVVHVGTLRPNRVVFLPSARAIVELPEGRLLPTPGDRIEVGA